jgi:cytoskeleton protein RodZ
VQSVFTSALPRSPDDRWFKATSYVLASVVVIALVWQFTTEAVRFSQGDSVVRSNGPEADYAGPAGQDANPGSNKSTHAVPAKSHLQASIAAMEDTNRARPEISRSGAEGAWSAISQVTAVETGVAPLQAGEQAFRINASADSWVEIIDGSGKKIEMDLLRAGSERNYVALAPVKLLLGRASSIELTHNGEAVDLAPHTRGNVARITLDEPAEIEVRAEPVSEPVSEPGPAPRTQPLEASTETEHQQG